MNRADLVEKINSDTGVSKAQATLVLESAMRTITSALKRGDHVTLSGFGVFSVYQRKARNGRNPQTGAILKIKAQRVARFSAGIELKEAVGKG